MIYKNQENNQESIDNSNEEKIDIDQLNTLKDLMLNNILLYSDIKVLTTSHNYFKICNIFEEFISCYNTYFNKILNFISINKLKFKNTSIDYKSIKSIEDIFTTLITQEQHNLNTYNTLLESLETSYEKSFINDLVKNSKLLSIIFSIMNDIWNDDSIDKYICEKQIKHVYKTLYADNKV